MVYLQKMIQNYLNLQYPIWRTHVFGEGVPSYDGIDC